MLERIKEYASQIKRLRIGVRSVNLMRFIIIMGLAPYVFATCTLIAITAMQNHDEWAFRLIDYALKISDKIFGPANVGAVLNLVPRWDDENDNGISDVDEKKEVIPLEKSDIGRHQDDG